MPQTTEGEKGNNENDDEAEGIDDGEETEIEGEWERERAINL